MYKYLNNKFNNSSLKIKIEFYILVILIACFFHYFSQNLYFENEVISSSKIKVDDFNKSFDGSYVELFSNLELLANRNGVVIQNLSREKNMITLSGNILVTKICDFIREIENINNFTKVDYLSLNKKDNLLNHSFELKINLNKFYIKNKIKLNKVEQEQKIKEFKLTAIISDYALINDIWIKKGGKIDNYELIEIKTNSVFIKKANQETKLELENE